MISINRTRDSRCNFEDVRRAQKKAKVEDNEQLPRRCQGRKKESERRVIVKRTPVILKMRGVGGRADGAGPYAKGESRILKVTKMRKARSTWCRLQTDTEREGKSVMMCDDQKSTWQYRGFLPS